jgi:hypothetical protein
MRESPAPPGSRRVYSLTDEHEGDRHEVTVGEKRNNREDRKSCNHIARNSSGSVMPKKRISTVAVLSVNEFVFFKLRQWRLISSRHSPDPVSCERPCRASWRPGRIDQAETGYHLGTRILSHLADQ